MKYRTTPEYDFDQQNESRADKAEAMLAIGSDRNGEQHDDGVSLDVSDAIAHFAHFCARAGLDFDEMVSRAGAAAFGDLEDGPEAARDPERFPVEVEAG